MDHNNSELTLVASYDSGPLAGLIETRQELTVVAQDKE